mmetsp:Transcript_13627/g.17203  ORF Transcript_13627/g.17203 Transcript_13627/m.17203 type:complete len:289 (-) Transcript_13627:86-952(-)
MLQIIFLSSFILLSQLYSVSAQPSLVAASKSEYWFSEAIQIDYDVTSLSEDFNKTFLWVGLYDEDPVDGAYYHYDALWSGICGSQDSWYEGCDGVMPTTGSITFSAKDPSHDSYTEFPIPDGNWYACLWTADYIAVGDCAEFKVKSLPSKVLNDATIGPIKPNVKTMTLTVSWETPIPIVKQWIGIFPVGDIIDGELPTNSTNPWLYTGCNNQSGNQEENNDCSLRKTNGRVTFNTQTIDRYTGTIWPPEQGTYKVCLVTHYEPPYTKGTYKCMRKNLKIPDLSKYLD